MNKEGRYCLKRFNLPSLTQSCRQFEVQKTSSQFRRQRFQKHTIFGRQLLITDAVVIQSHYSYEFATRTKTNGIPYRRFSKGVTTRLHNFSRPFERFLV